MRQVEQLVGRVPHRGQHGDDPAALLPRRREARGDGSQALGCADRGAAELHHDEAVVRAQLILRDGRNGLVLGRPLGQCRGTAQR